MRYAFPFVLLLIGCGGGEEYEGKNASQWLRTLKDKDPKQRSKAVQGLAEISLKDTTTTQTLLPSIIGALSDESPDVRRTAIKSLGRHRSQARGALPQLTAALSDGNTEVRAEAALALGDVDDRKGEVIPQLVKALADPDLEVRRSAVEALAHLGSKGRPAIPALQKLMDQSKGDPVFQHIVRGAMSEITTQP